MGRILLRQELLEERSCQPFGGFRQGSSSFPVSVVCITEDGENFLKNGAESLGIRLEPSEELIKHTKTKPHVVRKSSEDIKPASPQLKSTEQKPTSEPAEEAMKESVSELKLQQNLYDALLKTRQTLAFDFHIMPYVVASNLALQALCRNKPKTKQDLMELEGFNEAKVEKFGDAFIKTVNEVIARFSEENADRQWKEAIIKNEPVSPNNVNKVDSGEKWKEAIIKNEPVSPNNVSKVDSGEKAASNQNEVNNETNFQSYFDDEDDDIFKNLDDTDTTNLDVSSMNHKDLQNAVESISPELLKPGKSGIKHEDSQNSKSFLEGDMDLFENFDMPNTNSVGGAPSPTVSLSKLPSSSRGSTTNSSFFSNHDSSNKVSNQVKFTGNVKSSMGKAPPWNGSSKTTVSASSSRLVCKVNTSKRIKYSSDNSSDEESDSVTGKKLPNWLDANAKAEMDKKIKKNSLFK